MREHLAIFKKGLGDLILDGQKTIESRFSMAKMVPFGSVASGDKVYIKPTGGEVIGQFIVKKVISYDGLIEGDLNKIKEIYGDQIGADEDFWESHQSAKYGTLIFIGETNRFLVPTIQVPKKDSRGWVLLG